MKVEVDILARVGVDDLRGEAKRSVATDFDVTVGKSGANKCEEDDGIHGGGWATVCSFDWP